MQGLRLKFGDRRTDWKCCFCCHVRIGTILIGIWHLMLHALILSIMAVILSHREPDPVLPTPLSEVDNVSPETYLDWNSNNDASSIKPLPLLPHSYREFWEKQNLSHQDLNIGVVVTICSFTMTLMLIYGAITGKPSYLMPFFCLNVFDFCVAGISAIGYFCYPPDMNPYWMKKFILPYKEELSEFYPDTLVIFTAVAFVVIMLIKAYFISVIWRCYKYLSFRQIAAQRTVHFIDPVVQNLLPDLPDYETAVKKFPTPPPSYASAVREQSCVAATTDERTGNSSSQPLSAQRIVIRLKMPNGNSPPPQSNSENQVSKPEII